MVIKSLTNMKNRYYYLFCLALLSMLYSCSDENPIETEQYFKQIYIIGAIDIIKTTNVPYGEGPQSTFITISSGGSLNLDKDVKVTLTTNDATVDWYNNKYMIDTYMKYSKLKHEYYDIPSMELTIKAGEVYSRLPFTINSSSIHCDSLYALTFKIESVSEYQKAMKDTVLMMNLNMVNDYSGNYQMAMIKYTIDPNTGEETFPNSMNVSRALKAVDKNSVRFFNETTPETTGSYSTKDDYFNAIDNNCIVFEYNETEKKFKAKGWKNLEVVDSDITYVYDSKKEKGRFEFSYDYKSGSTIYRIKGTLAQ